MRERSRIGNLLSRRLVSLSFRLFFSFSVFHVKDHSLSGLSTGLSARPSRRTFPRLYPSLGLFHGSFRLSVPPTASDRQGAVWGVGEKWSPRGLSTPNCWGPMPRTQSPKTNTTNGYPRGCLRRPLVWLFFRSPVLLEPSK